MSLANDWLQTKRKQKISPSDKKLANMKIKSGCVNHVKGNCILVFRILSHQPGVDVWP